MSVEEVRRLVAQAREKLRREDVDGAVGDLDRALALNPDHIPALYYRAWAHGSGNVEAAQAGYRRIAELEAVDVDDFYFRGLANQAVDRPREAERDFRLALHQAPPDHPRRAELESRLPTKPHESDRAPRVAPASLILLGASVAVWILQGEPAKTPDGETLIERGALERTAVLGGEYWRLLTATFLHIGPVHLFWNVVAGYSWCAPVERQLGSVRFAILFLLSGLAGSAISLIGHDAVSAGASGALFGVIGAVLVLWYQKLGSVRAFAEHPRVRSHLGLIALWFVLGVTLMPMDNYGHLGGLLGGLLWGWAFVKRPSLLSQLTALAATAVLCVAACLPWYAPDVEVRRAWRAAQEAWERKDWPEAERQFTEALALDPRNPDLLFNRAIVRAELKNVEGARADLRAAILGAPPGWDAAPAKDLLEALSD